MLELSIFALLKIQPLRAGFLTIEDIILTMSKLNLTWSFAVR
jgi:hypothetical protein